MRSSYLRRRRDRDRATLKEPPGSAAADRLPRGVAHDLDAVERLVGVRDN
jgi:hypothetical protein